MHKVRAGKFGGNRLTFAGAIFTPPKIHGLTTNVIKGFAPGDTIDLPLVQYNFREFTQFLNWQSNQLKIYATGIGEPVYQLQFDPSQNFFGNWFELSPDATGGTEISARPS